MGRKWFNRDRMGYEKNYVINYLHGKNTVLDFTGKVKV